MKRNRMKPKGIKRTGAGRVLRNMLPAAAVFVLALILGAVPAKADTAEPGPGSITLELEYKDDSDVVHPMQDGEVSLYTAAVVTEASGALQYDLSGGVFADVNDAQVQEIPELTQEQMDQESRLHTLADKLVQDYLEGRECRTAAVADGAVYFDGLHPGLYLVVNSRAASDGVTFSPFLMTLPDEKGSLQMVAKPKPGMVPPETVPEEPTKESPPEEPPKESTLEEPTKEPAPEEPTKESAPTEPATGPSGGGGSGGGGRSGGGTYSRPATQEDPVYMEESRESTVLGAVRDNADQVLGAIRNPQQVLGAVRTGDPSAIFICGEILVLAAALLMGWFYAWRKLIKRD